MRNPGKKGDLERTRYLCIIKQDTTFFSRHLYFNDFEFSDELWIKVLASKKYRGIGRDIPPSWKRLKRESSLPAHYALFFN